MNVDFEDEYGRRIRRKVKRKRLLHDYFYPTIVAIIFIASLAVFKYLTGSS